MLWSDWKADLDKVFRGVSHRYEGNDYGKIVALTSKEELFNLRHAWLRNQTEWEPLASVMTEIDFPGYT